jgi:ubiquinone/menaquinone biosynthesis C-methylase UbiE
MNNLFEHADKELVIDAFLCWLITEMNEEYLIGLRNDFVSNFLKYDESVSGVVKKLKAAKQENKVDVLCTLETDQGDKEILFENKLRSTAHGGQLKRYRVDKPNAIDYIYLKLGYVHLLDREAAEGEGYSVKTANDIADLLAPYEGKHPFIDEFYKYVNQGFVKPQSQFEKYLDDDAYSQLDDAEFQQFVMEKIYRKLKKSGWKDTDLKFKTSANIGSGTPWTQLYFSKISEKYDINDEVLFFRIDKRSKKLYLRVNLYSKEGDKYWQEKKERVKRLREVAGQMQYGAKIHPGNVHNRARNEVEIAIYFFKEGNSLANLINESVHIARTLRKAHQELG